MNAALNRPKILTFTSGKGGVGKTFLALQTAGELAKSGQRVLLFDGDMGLANVHVLLGIRPALTLSDVVAGRCSLQEAIVEGPYGLRILPGGSGHRVMADLESSEIVKILQNLLEVPSAPDFIVMDTGAGIGRHVTTFAQIADRILVVAKDEPASLADAYGLIKVMYSDFGRQNFDVLVNDVGTEERGRAVFNKLQEVTTRFLGLPLACAGVVPHDGNARLAARNRRLLSDEVSLSPATRAIRSVAAHYAGMASQSQDSSFLLDRLGLTKGGPSP